MDASRRGVPLPTIEMPDEFVQTAEEFAIANAQDCFGPAAEQGMVRKRHSSSSPESDSTDSAQPPAKVQITNNHTSVVASHYNNLDEKGLFARSQSRIVYMRNFNNWIKSLLINDFLTKVKDGLTNRAPIRVLDMCCGKGGDLLKWQKINITHLICTDIADVSIEQCESRYQSMLERDRTKSLYTAEFITCDNTNTRLRERYKDPSIELNLVSCQFAFHYCFESLKQAECMLKNAAECLKTGGYFIGTIPDANDIMRRQRETGLKTFGNEIYHISFLCDTEYPPLFGAKYNFHLEGVVDCPEFLVYFPMLVKLARKFGLELVMKERFEDYFDKKINQSTRNLLEKMQGLETFPPGPGREPVTLNPNDYAHVREQRDRYKKVGTLSKSEWEATSLYLAFAFRKMKKVWNEKGEPEFVSN